MWVIDCDTILKKLLTAAEKYFGTRIPSNGVAT
jgi:hypothetical protein